MKQGHATHTSSGGTKVEPKAHAVSPRAVSDIGNQVLPARGHTSTPLYEGRGLEAPMKSCTTHHCGSQGRHK